MLNQKDDALYVMGSSADSHAPDFHAQKDHTHAKQISEEKYLLQLYWEYPSQMDYDVLRLVESFEALDVCRGRIEKYCARLLTVPRESKLFPTVAGTDRSHRNNRDNALELVPLVARFFHLPQRTCPKESP